MHRNVVASSALFSLHLVPSLARSIPAHPVHLALWSEFARVTCSSFGFNAQEVVESFEENKGLLRSRIFVRQKGSALLLRFPILGKPHFTPRCNLMACLFPCVQMGQEGEAQPEVSQRTPLSGRVRWFPVSVHPNPCMFPWLFRDGVGQASRCHVLLVSLVVYFGVAPRPPMPLFPILDHPIDVSHWSKHRSLGGGGGPLRTRADHPHVSFLSLLPPAPQIRLPWRSPPSPCERRASQEHRVGSKISMGGIEISRSRVGQHEWSTDCVRRAFARLFEPTSRHNTSHHKEEGGSLEDGMDRRRI